MKIIIPFEHANGRHLNRTEVPAGDPAAVAVLARLISEAFPVETREVRP